MSRESTIPKIYAEALLELAASRDRLEPVAEAVRFLAELFRKDKELKVFLESPNVDFAAKQQAFETALRGRIADEALDFLLVVLKRGRELFFVRMLEEFEVLYRKQSGIVQAQATTAVAVDAAVLEELRLALERSLGLRVVLESTVDEGILGGFVVRFDGMVLDGSLRRDLERLKATMEGRKFGSELFYENPS